MPRSRIIGMWIITVIAIMATTFVTFIAISAPVNYGVIPAVVLMWFASIGLTHSIVQIHRMYWK